MNLMNAALSRPILLLAMANIFWAMNPFFSKVLLEHLPPYEAAWWRYASSFLAFLILPITRLTGEPKFIKPKSSKHRGLFVFTGLMAFCIGPFLQFTGLSMAQSVDNALMVALEPLVTVLLAWVILGERLKLKDWISLCFGLFGFLLLSKALVFGNGNQPYSGVMGGLSLGYILLFLSLTGEGVYSSLGRKLSFDYPATAIFGNLLLIGTCAMTVVIAIRGFHVFEGWSPKSIFAILWLGPVSTLGGYLLWMLILSKKEIAGMVVTLFIQPLVGALIGVFYLGETISLLQIFGALLIMSGVLVEAFFDFKQKRAIS